MESNRFFSVAQMEFYKFQRFASRVCSLIAPTVHGVAGSVDSCVKLAKNHVKATSEVYRFNPIGPTNDLQLQSAERGRTCKPQPGFGPASGLWTSSCRNSAAMESYIEKARTIDLCLWSTRNYCWGSSIWSSEWMRCFSDTSDLVSDHRKKLEVEFRAQLFLIG